MIKITNFRLDIGDDGKNIKERVEKILSEKVESVSIVSRSIDARRSGDVHYVLTLSVYSKAEEKIKNKNIKNVSFFTPFTYKLPEKKERKTRPLVVGAGPCGLFATLYMSRAGLDPILIERGDRVENRIKKVEDYWNGKDLDVETNVQFGEGGAGAFSDGKLNTGTNDKRIQQIFKDFVLFGANEDILIDKKPHIGTDVLRDIVKNIRKEIEKNGGEIRFNTKLCDIGIKDAKVKSAIVEQNNKKYEIETDTILLAIGHSAKDTVKMLSEKGVLMEKKPFAIGARIEHSEEFISSSMYKNFAKLLPPADYKMAIHLPDNRVLYTFCMCPGGYVVAAASDKESIVTNGMSYSKRDAKNSNSALLVNVRCEDFPSDDPLSGYELQKSIEKRAYNLTKSNKAPCQSVKNFLKKGANEIKNVKPTYMPGVVLADMCDILPSFVTNATRQGLLQMDKKIPGFASGDAILTGPETRSSSPVRFIRDENMQLSIKGLMSAGEGGGHAGGITSSAVEGVKAAEIIITKGDM